MKPDFEKIAGDLYRNQFPRGDNFATACTTIDAINNALEDAYRAGMFDGKQEMRQEITPQRKELGCQNASCFCTGRCKRTAEEQEAHERMEKQHGGWFFGRGDK